VDISINNYLLGIVTINEDKVICGGCPVFKAADKEEMEQTSLLLARITGGTVHDLENGVYIIVKH